MDNNISEEIINKDVSKNTINEDENVKTHKKKEDNFQINPQILFNFFCICHNKSN